MELDLCIKGRRSVRSYLDRPVPKEVIADYLMPLSGPLVDE
jgi:nitroreductase